MRSVECARYTVYVHYKNWFTIKCREFSPTNTARKLSFSLSHSMSLSLLLLLRFLFGTSQFWTVGFMATVQCQLKWDFINLINNLILNSMHSILDQWWQYCNVIHTHSHRRRDTSNDAYKFPFAWKLRAFVNEHRMKCLRRAKQRN